MKRGLMATSTTYVDGKTYFKMSSNVRDPTSNFKIFGQNHNNSNL